MYPFLHVGGQRDYFSQMTSCDRHKNIYLINRSRLAQLVERRSAGQELTFNTCLAGLPQGLITALIGKGTKLLQKLVPINFL